MTVFISWSGPESKHVAAALREWLPNVIQGLEVFMSDGDIPPGTRWFSNIASQLEASSYGVICVTPSNQESPWLNFEAGAIGKETDGAFVTPFVVSMEKEQISGPLSGFNALNSNKQGFRELVKSINESLPGHAPEAAVLSAAEKYWPEVEAAIGSRPTGDAPAPAFDPDEALKEVRELVRQLVRDQQEDRETAASTSVSLPGIGAVSGVSGISRRSLQRMSTEELLTRVRSVGSTGGVRASSAAIYRSELFRRAQAGEPEAVAYIAPLVEKGKKFVDDFMREDPLDP